jgi:hypothetical protein
MRKLLVLCALALAACSSPPPISSNPVQTVTNAVSQTQVGKTVQQGLLDSEWNLDQAIAIGVLPANDPADACLHAALTQIGIEPGTTPPATAQQFTPRISDLISGGSVLYILAQQAKQLKGAAGITVPVACEAVVGKFVLDAGALGLNAIPGGSIVPVVPPAARKH